MQSPMLLRALAGFVGTIIAITTGAVLLGAISEITLVGRDTDLLELPFRGIYFIANTSPYSWIVILIAGAIGAKIAAGRRTSAA